ncbi:MAG TPA: hypothetical protein VLR94_09920, partial [Acidobacteriota bacterium]|nr:hypothetical protein [Acidobacteriota bacterium]
MNGKQFPFLGLILAILLGPRAVNRSDTPRPARGASNRVEKTHSAKETTNTTHAAKAVPALANGGCTGPAANDLERRWWLTGSGQECALSVSPVWREICKINPGHPSDEALLDPGLKEEEFRKRCLGNAGPIRSMMAAVPNPQHTHLGLMTDRAIEAIQVAASEARFLPLAHYLPWPAPGSGSGGGASESQGDSSEPGVLIFQDADEIKKVPPRPKYLLVFLIPEMPTEGLNRSVFLNAGRMIGKASPGMRVIRLAGPNFSGSVASLADLQMELQEQQRKKETVVANGADGCDKAPGPFIHAVSGSVTNPQKTLAPCLTFEVTQTKDKAALCYFVKSAESFGYASDEIAILSEEGTQYGRQSPVDQGPTDQTPASQTPTSQAVLMQAREKQDSAGSASVPDSCELDNPEQANSSQKSHAQLWFLHFPREISKLRNAYGAEQGKATGSDSASAELELQWQDAEGSQRDDLQTYGGRQTPLSQEAVLSSLSITLKAQGIKALGILATDPMDEAFLIHSIKKSSPDVRLFVRDPDLLFLRTPDVGSLNGTLLVSNYPLVPANQFWSSTNDTKKGQDANVGEDTSEHHMITFPSAFQEGEYNAFVELLEDEDKDENWAPANTTLKRLEWDWPAGMSAGEGDTDASKRPLWLAVIGTAGHYPIRVLNYKALNSKEATGDKGKLHSLNVGRPQLLPMISWAF